jgi:hypothetical protein
MTAAGGDALSHVTSMTHRPPIRGGAASRPDGIQKPVFEYQNRSAHCCIAACAEREATAKQAGHSLRALLADISTGSARTLIQSN